MSFSTSLAIARHRSPSLVIARHRSGWELAVFGGAGAARPVDYIPPVKHLVPHPLNQADGKRALEAAWSHYAGRYPKHSPSLQWLSPEQARVGFHAMGMDLSGSVRVLDRALELDLDVPFVLRPFVGRAKHAIEREVARWAQQFQRGD